MGKVTSGELSGFPALAGVSAGALAALADNCSARAYGDGELVIGHNETSYDVFFLLSGAATVNLYSADGQRVGFQDVPSGVMFGEISAIDGQPRSATVESRGKSRIATLARARFMELMAREPSFALAVSRQLADNVRRLTTRVFEFSTMQVRHRLRAELLRLAEQAGARNGPAVIDPMPTHAEIASRISTHREAVSREMAWLDAQGFMKKQGRSLVIPDVARIRGLLEASWQE